MKHEVWIFAGNPSREISDLLADCGFGLRGALAPEPRDFLAVRSAGGVVPRLIGGSGLMHGPALAGVFHWPDPFALTDPGAERILLGRAPTLH